MVQNKGIQYLISTQQILSLAEGQEFTIAEIVGHSANEFEFIRSHYWTQPVEYNRSFEVKVLDPGKCAEVGVKDQLDPGPCSEICAKEVSSQF